MSGSEKIHENRLEDFVYHQDTKGKNIALWHIPSGDPHKKSESEDRSVCVASSWLNSDKFNHKTFSNKLCGLYKCYYHPFFAGAGSTATIISTLNGYVDISSLGDSTAYLIREYEGGRRTIEITNPSHDVLSCYDRLKNSLDCEKHMCDEITIDLAGGTSEFLGKMLDIAKLSLHDYIALAKKLKPLINEHYTELFSRECEKERENLIKATKDEYLKNLLVKHLKPFDDHHLTYAQFLLANYSTLRTAHGVNMFGSLGDDPDLEVQQTEPSYKRIDLSAQTHRGKCINAWVINASDGIEVIQDLPKNEGEIEIEAGLFKHLKHENTEQTAQSLAQASRDIWERDHKEGGRYPDDITIHLFPVMKDSKPTEPVLSIVADGHGGEAVSQAVLENAATELAEIYYQHQHQSLTRPTEPFAGAGRSPLLAGAGSHVEPTRKTIPIVTRKMLLKITHEKKGDNSEALRALLSDNPQKYRFKITELLHFFYDDKDRWWPKKGGFGEGSFKQRLACAMGFVQPSQKTGTKACKAQILTNLNSELEHCVLEGDDRQSLKHFVKQAEKDFTFTESAFAGERTNYSTTMLNRLLQTQSSADHAGVSAHA